MKDTYNNTSWILLQIYISLVQPFRWGLMYNMYVFYNRLKINDTFWFFIGGGYDVHVFNTTFTILKITFYKEEGRF